MNTLELKIPPALVLLIFGLAMWFTADFTPSLAFVLPWRVAICIAFFLAGGFFGVSGILAFQRARTTLNPINPDSASAMVIGGIYRYSRNPMYFALLLALIGWATYLSNALTFLLLPLFVIYMNRFQIIPEERALSAKFGSVFSSYIQSVRRWI